MIRYSNGTIVNRLFTMDGTRTALVTQITSALTDAGWSTISSGIYQSATTPTGQKCRLQVRDVGPAENYVGVRLVNPTLNAREFFVKPVNGRLIRVWANKYQIFFFSSGAVFPSDGCDFAAGVLWMPTFLPDVLTDNYAGWMSGSASRNSSNIIIAEQTNIGFHGSMSIWGSWGAKMWDAACTGDQNVDGGQGRVYVLGQVSRGDPNGTDVSCYWEDGSLAIWEPVMCIYSGHTTSGNWSPQVRQGQIWDALVWPRQLFSETVKAIFSKNWMGVTHNSGSTGGTSAHNATLMLLNA